MSNTICAISTAQGGAIGIIRISGPQAIQITDTIFRGRQPLTQAKGYTIHYGQIVNSSPLGESEGAVIDDVLLTLFRAPHSYTGEDSVEISCHGSSYILQTICQLLISQGCRQALPGEYTQRAFLNGKLDLSQAEAVADLIASNNASQHRVAMSQLRGGISSKLADLRTQLLHLTSLLELELDFSDHEDLEFADRTQLTTITHTIISEITHLRDSFQQGNAIKQGIPVAIIGAPNVGKSTLLNQLLQDDKAIVSDIQGTTRDTIEDTIYLSSPISRNETRIGSLPMGEGGGRGCLFRFIDTAGIRDTTDTIEQLGIQRSIKAAERAHIIILLTEPDVPYPTLSPRPDQHVIYVQNKIDKTNQPPLSTRDYPATHLTISALTGTGLDALRQSLLDHAAIITGTADADNILITNLRHKEALDRAYSDLQRALTAMHQGISGDLIAEDLRLCLAHLADIVGGQITPDEVLGNIFKNFCIGK